MYREESYSRIIAISGNTDAGKSTLAKLLAKKLEACIVAWDEYSPFRTTRCFIMQTFVT